MSTLRDLVEEYTTLDAADVEHLHRLAGEWQLVSDLSFADLLLWVKLSDDDAFVCIAQVRPTTGPTAYEDDQVGRLARRFGRRTPHGRRGAGPDLARGRPGLVRRRPGPATKRSRSGDRAGRT